MSYQVLARKWRPGNFSQVAGQEHVLKTLINALDRQRLHHAYLFTGARGTGKTTLARILAKCFNCEQGVSSNPCGNCGACLEINQGRMLDLYEIDAASRTKVEDTRELLENVQFAPARARFKVYLIDEVHMLSTHSFNALLKTLEEPPEHVKFLFATTDPQKLPVTILSRCLQFNLKNLSPNTIVKYLGPVLEQEQIAHEPDALWQIAAAAGGSMRDALTLIDQAISYCQGSIGAEAVVEMLGIPPQRQVLALLEAMAAANLRAVLEISENLAGQIPDYSQTLDSLLSTLHRLAIAQAFPAAIDNNLGDRQEILQLAGKFSAEDLQLYYQIGNKGRDELALPGDARAAFEMLLLRMLVFAPEPVIPVAGQSDSGTTGAAPEQDQHSPAENGEAAAPERDQHSPAENSEAAAPAEPAAAAVEAREGIARAAPINGGNGKPELDAEPADGLVAKFEKDRNVQQMLKHFSGKVLRESVSPLSGRGDK